MEKRYTLTFETKLRDIDKSLKRLQELGVVIESVQRFIGTAVVQADSTQVEKIIRMKSVAGVSETGAISAM